MTTPQVGLFLPQLMMSFDQIMERVEVAEEVGLESVWFMDHLVAPMRHDADVLEAWTLMAAVAARTDRVRLGLLVGCDAFRHPSLLAKMAVTVDQISNGRLNLGLGWGSVPAELDMFGLGQDAPRVRAARLEESLQVLSALFAGEPVDFDGPTMSLQQAICRPRPVNGSIPVHIGGSGTQLTMPIVRRHADWWNCPSYGADRLAELAPQAGSARISVSRPVGLVLDGDDRDEVVSRAQRRFGSWGGLVTGTPTEVATQLSQDVALGAELFILQLTDFGQPRSIRALAEEVVPALRQQVWR